jgi:signal transduction histidine kinase
LIAASASLIDVLIDAYAYGYGSFWEVFVSSSPGIIFGRIYIMGSFTVIGIFVDLYMHARAKYSKQLETEVKERTRELVEAQNKLLKAERLAAIGQTAGMVSHDLRSPLQAIAGAEFFLKKHGQSKMNDKEKDMLITIEKAIKDSNNIINDLLEYSTEMKLERGITDPKSLVDETLAEIEVPVTIAVENKTKSEPRVEVDKSKIKRVFLNLIKNAVDAMPNGGVLTIKSVKAEEQLSFDFVDTGTGISEENMQRVWTPFFTTKAKGMGLGLAICKRIIEAHGGKIDVESQFGKGTVFSICIPIKHKLNNSA